MQESWAPAGVKPVECNLALNPLVQRDGPLFLHANNQKCHRCTAFRAPESSLHRSVHFYHLVLVGGLDTGLQPQTGKLLLHPQLCVRLRLKGKSGSTSVDCLGCKPIPARLSPFSPPVPELLQCGCSWCRPSMVWSIPELSNFSPLRTPPYTHKQTLN